MDWLSRLAAALRVTVSILWQLHCETLPAAPRRSGQRLAAVPRRDFMLIVDSKSYHPGIRKQRPKLSPNWIDYFAQSLTQ